MPIARIEMPHFLDGLFHRVDPGNTVRRQKLALWETADRFFRDEFQSQLTATTGIAHWPT